MMLVFPLLNKLAFQASNLGCCFLLCSRPAPAAAPQVALLTSRSCIQSGHVLSGGFLLRHHLSWAHTPNSRSGGLCPSQCLSQCLENFIPLPCIPPHSPQSRLVMLPFSHARSFHADITITQAVTHWKISFPSSTNI